MLAVATVTYQDCYDPVVKGTYISFDFLSMVKKNKNGRYILPDYVMTDAGRYPSEYLSFQKCESLEEIAWLNAFADDICKNDKICLFSLDFDIDSKGDGDAEYFGGWLTSTDNVDDYLNYDEEETAFQSVFNHFVRSIAVDHSMHMLEVYAKPVLDNNGISYHPQYKRRIFKDGKAKESTWVKESGEEYGYYDFPNDKELFDYVKSFFNYL